MTNHNPSGAARVFVLAGPALALLFTVFAFATGTGVGFIRGVWFGAALWSFLATLAHVLWRGFRHGDWVRPQSLRTLRRERGSVRLGDSDRTLRLAPRPGGAGASRSRPGYLIPASRPGEVEPGREGGGGRASGRMSASFKHPPGGDDMMQTRKEEAHTFLTHLTCSAAASKIRATPSNGSARWTTATSFPCPPGGGRRAGAGRSARPPPGEPCGRCGPRGTRSSSARP